MITELSWQSLAPRLITSHKEIALTTGESFSYALSEKRYCVGYRQFGASTHTQCPSNSEIPPGKETQCEFCRPKDISFTAKTGYGLSRQANDFLDADHVVYLAYFSDSIIKVGVALWDRREVRVSEQGAIACMFIAKGNGTVARNLERRIHTNAGFTEWVRLDTKLKSLFENRLSEEKVRSHLLHAFTKIKKLAPSAVLFNQPNFLYLLPRYQIQNDTYSSRLTLAKEVDGGAQISGTLVGIYGKYC